jgi:hypothetical protein
MREDVTSESLLIWDVNYLPGAKPEDRALKDRRFKEPWSEKRFVLEQHSHPGLEEIARYGGYQSYHPSGNTDSWVRSSLKIFDKETYDRIYGFTRRGEGPTGEYKALFRYSQEISHFTELSRDQRAAMVSSIAETRSAFKLPYKNSPLDWHQVGEHMKTDTSAGLSFPGLKKKDCMEQIYTEARWLGHRMKEGGKGRFDPTKVRFPPCAAGSRGHMSPRDDPKTRLVWIYPAEMLVVEGLWAPVMYRSIMDLPNGPLLIGKSSQRLYGEWMRNYKDGEKLHGLDFKAFDTKVPPWLIHTAFDILHQNVEWETWNGRPVSKRNRQKWRNVWDGMKYYFINTPILMPDGRMFRKHHGVPSGSYFTQLVDSVVNMILVKYLAKCQHMTVSGLKVLGDDSAFRSPSSMDLVQAQSDADAVNMDLGVEKCEITEEPTQFKLLGTTYRNSHCHRDDDEWFKLALYPENIPPDIGTSMSRLVGLWLGGAMFSQKFCLYFDFYQSCFQCPVEGWFSKEQKKWMSIVFGGRSPAGWSFKRSLYWRSFMYTL